MSHCTILSKYGIRTRLLKIKSELKIGKNSQHFVVVFYKTVIPHFFLLSFFFF